MRLNFWIATLVCLAGLAWFVWIQKRGKYDPLPLDGPSADARVVVRRKPSAPVPQAAGARRTGRSRASGARPTSRSGGRRRGADPLRAVPRPDRLDRRPRPGVDDLRRGQPGAPRGGDPVARDLEPADAVGSRS